jgi:GTPase SAR1 family protein
LESLNGIADWKIDVDKNVEEYQSLLVGNKTDLVEERVVSAEEGQNMATKLGMNYIESSVRLDKNVNRAFELIARSVHDWLF